ncbi:MAG TPA: SpoIIE family protein phosphatase [Bacteroidia bacterium]|nr:SpoIIE family protein phosphatase [Bacteroidia bacterium]
MITALIVLIVLALAGIITAVIFLVLKNRLKKEFDKSGSEITKYQSIIDQANDAMLVIDIVDGRIHQSNPSAASLLGYTQKELNTRSLFDLHPVSELEKSSRVVADVWEQGGLIYSDIPFVTKDGQLLAVECSAKVAPFEGRPAIVIYARDIRERLRLEKEVSLQKSIIEQKNKDITDSINYARRIQQAILPTPEEMRAVVPEHFVFYRPKDIVSGDLYWAATTAVTGDQQKKRAIVAALDCTGHGVPGAFMSIVGHTILEQTLSESSVSNPAMALDYLNRGVIKTLKQKTNDGSINDGMDIALCAIDFENLSLEYAGANNPVYIIRKGSLKQIAPDKQPIGAYLKVTRPFTNHAVPLEKGDCIYIFTDGIPDQFGGPRGKKFKYKQLQDLLLSNYQLPMAGQREAIRAKMEEWMSYEGEFEQTDDMLIIGIRIN